jgi:hypothetical protein
MKRLLIGQRRSQLLLKEVKCKHIEGKPNQSLQPTALNCATAELYTISGARTVQGILRKERIRLGQELSFESNRVAPIASKNASTSRKIIRRSRSCVGAE